MPARKRATMRARDAPSWPVWFPNNPRAQQISEWLAFNAWVDTALGLTPSPDRWPYSDFKRPAVEKLLARLAFVSPEAAP